MFVDRISCLLEFIALPILMALMLVGFQTMPQFNLKVYFSTYFLTLRSCLSCVRFTVWLEHFFVLLGP